MILAATMDYKLIATGDSRTMLYFGVAVGVVILLIVIGTLKNTLGPHHAGPQVGSAWPAMFQKGPAHGPPPGSAYHTLGYGLFEPFLLSNVAE